MKRSLKLIGPAVLVVLAALMIAFLLRDVVEQVVIRPAIYLFWLLGILYHAIAQPVLWLALVLVMLYLTLAWLVGRLKPPSGPLALNSIPMRGPVDELALRIAGKDEGIYFKWQIARTLGQLAVDLQNLRQHTHSRKLEFNNARATPRVRKYLDSGLNTSFSDYPLPGRLHIPGSRAQAGRSTPFDGDIGPIITYLESELENDDDFRRP